MARLSLTYRIIRGCGVNIPEEEYGQISPLGTVKKLFIETWHALLLNYSMYSALLAPWNYRILRPIIWRWLGAKVGKHCFIGDNVYIDLNHSNLISVADNVHIDTRCFLLCHKRNLDTYRKGDNYSKLGYKYGPISIGTGCSIGSGSMILPGVTIGEGAIIGAGSLVTKDIPAWAIATGRPAKVVRYISEKEDESDIGYHNQ